MKRYRLLLLVSLSLLAGAVVGHPAMAQGYGSKPRIISVSSTGSRLNGLPGTEVIAAGQTRTLLDHSGPAAYVWVWIPVTYASGPRGWFDWSVTLADRQRLQVRDFNAVRLGSKLLGWTISYCTDYFPFTECYCRLQEPYRELWGGGWSIHQNLLLR